MADRKLTRPWVMRVAGFVEFVVAMVLATTPLLRSVVGDTLGYAVCAVMLFSSATMFVVAHWMERMAAQTPSGG